MRSLLFLILILASSFWCYENYGQNLPVRTILSHTDGRSMEVVVLSREQTQVTFKRQSDGRRYSCEIGDLSLLSKCKVYWHFRDSSGAGTVRGTSQDLHLEGIRDEMNQLAEDLSLAPYRFNASQTNAQKRTVENEIEALELKVDKLKLKEAKYLSGRN
ncbi:MAG: hypothetical protein ABS34_00865 [Opitutaceae bacterium BACL24 MAG-120322-bin51]|jgi:hypothetical protein|nr:MAG: hypothetical protein ABS34_00865 [Opitutaceae bacterium BACL24 MAG-120322-bin51]